MTELNIYGLYNQNMGISPSSTKDEVDSIIDSLNELHNYEDVLEYVKQHFGTASGEEWIEYPEINKNIYLFANEEMVEVCALKNEKQYYGKGWKKVNQ